MSFALVYESPLLPAKLHPLSHLQLTVPTVHQHTILERHRKKK